MSDLATALLASLAFAAVAFCTLGVILLAILIAAWLGARADPQNPVLREVTPARRSASANRLSWPPT